MKKHYLFLLIIFLAITRANYAFDNNSDIELNNRIINQVEITFDNNASMHKFLSFANLQCEFKKTIITIDNIEEDNSEDIADIDISDLHNRPLVIYYFEPTNLNILKMLLKLY